MRFSGKLRKLTFAVALATGSAVLATGTLSPAWAFDAPPPVRVEMTIPDFSALVERNAVAVVNITVSGKDQPAAAWRGMPDLNDDNNPFAPFFKRFPMPKMPHGGKSQPLQGMGSGFLISSDGYLITNHHVIDGAGKITVKLNDKREFPAKVIGSDPQSDIALLKIDAKGLPVVTVGNPGDLKVGQWVFAIGAPFGLERTATKGIVSALGRSLPNDTYVPFIQTDVPINPGNSGGPLFDLSGQVVGINSQIFSRSGGYMGLSFAIPADVAMDVVAQLKAEGRVTRGWLGITLQEVTQDLARSFNLDQPRGALVSAVNADSPAAKAGLKPGDVIIGYAGKPIVDSADLPPLVGSTKPNVTETLTIIREGKQQEIPVTLGALPDQDQNELAMSSAPDDGSPRLNVLVADLPPGQGEEGVRVQQVGPGIAAEAGVQAGDILVSLNRQPVKSAQQLQQLVKQLPAGKRVPLLVKRDGGSLYLALEVPAKEHQAG
ncbi:MAG TPA: DegQ family serine endoprotease [Candidatus Competibacteraceae bacterium]|nr:DegQ family serine endoprotease [Candidatus Competibacteraceae bacterium]MCP5132932.1 DegQ family serine endoprotease [Gammaproteobacteria bacterium]HRX71316.1 DegQ family serine endoprotease [Candidatus Competibacteraceae bacterium]